jgi:hypothetical protein
MKRQFESRAFWKAMLKHVVCRHVMGRSCYFKKLLTFTILYRIYLKAFFLSLLKVSRDKPR